MRVIWPRRSRGFWDHGLLMSAAEGTLWPPVLGPCEQVLEGEPGGGGALVAAGPVVRDHGPEVYGVLGRMPWAVYVHSSDEELQHSSHLMRSPTVRTWVQYARPETQCDRRMLIGAQADTLDMLRDVPRLPLAERERWFFSGQTGHAERRACIRELRNRVDGRVVTTGGFAQGFGRKEYLRALAGAMVAPCPSGPNSPDSFRLYEAISCGCVPICNRRAPAWRHPGNYWVDALGFEPFPCVDDWSEVHGLLSVFADPLVAQAQANVTQAWWLAYRRKVACDLADDCMELDPVENRPYGQRVTILMPTSWIPSHPSTALIEDTVARLRAYPDLTGAEIVIMIDGLHQRHAEHVAAYEEYKRRLIDLCLHDARFAGCLPITFSEHRHQAEMARAALAFVRTPLVFYVEHDTYPMGEVPFSRMFDVLEREPKVRVIRLHIFDGIHEQHRDLYRPPVDVGGLPLSLTKQWSQRPHLARKTDYRDWLERYFPPKEHWFIEDKLHSVLFNELNAGDWERWGVYVYAPEGTWLRSGHSDGRAGAPKAE